MRLHTILLLARDGPHCDPILELGESPLDLAEIFVHFQRFERGRILPLGLDEILAFQRLFLWRRGGVFEEVEFILFIFPIEIARSVMTGEPALKNFPQRSKPAPGQGNPGA